MKKLAAAFIASAMAAGMLPPIWRVIRGAARFLVMLPVGCVVLIISGIVVWIKGDSQGLWATAIGAVALALSLVLLWLAGRLAKRTADRLFVLASVSMALTFPAHADPVWAIRPEPNLVCMTVHGDINEKKILQHPTAGTQSSVEAGPVVFVVQPLHAVRGFVEVERPDRTTGWILQSDLSPSTGKCIPTLMSNGLIWEGE